MGTGRLEISRGHELRARAEADTRPVGFAPAPPRSALEVLAVRLDALERLAGLLAQGALSADEFAVEKSLILRWTGGDAARSLPPQPAAASTSLAERAGASRPLGALLLATLCGGAAWLAWPDEAGAMAGAAAAWLGL